MAKADIEITFHDASDSFGYPRYQPDTRVRGTATVFPTSTINCKHLYIRLIWYTEGRGTRFRQVIEQDDLFQGELQSGLPRSFEFQFLLPDSPWSHEGHYISVVWGIEVQIDISLAKDPKAVGNFLLDPDRSNQSEW
ncbi:MAG: hypothetical protein GY943_14335 [Chloroflexi bacterium]|nr:hypothetical protein [Chloroflexota bacterium]